METTAIRLSIIRQVGSYPLMAYLNLPFLSELFLPFQVAEPVAYES